MTKYELNTEVDYDTIRIDEEDMVELRQLSSQIITHYRSCDLQTIRIMCLKCYLKMVLFIPWNHTSFVFLTFNWLPL